MKHLLTLFVAGLLSLLPAAAQIPTADPLQGKSIGVIGDSYVQNHVDRAENTWHYKFARKHGMQYYNYGKNGTCIARDLPRWGEGIYKRYAEMKDTLDYVVVIAGHNDTTHMDSIGIGLFRERLSQLCEGLIEKYPSAQILFFTPWTCKGFKGSNRELVVDAMLDVCGSYGIPVFDSARRSGIYADSDRCRSVYFQGGGVNDDAHLNARGHDRFLPVAEAFILQYVQAKD